MSNFKQLLSKPLANVRTGTVVAFFVIALLGFADATFLTIEHYRNVVPPCTTAGCDVVLTSSYAMIGPVPEALIGAVYYLFLVLASFMFLESRLTKESTPGHHEKIIKAAFFTTALGFLYSLWLVYLQAFIIKSYCLYCLGSALITTILFVIAFSVLRKNENV